MPLHVPVEIRASSARVAAEGGELEVLLSFDGPTPLELSVTLTPPDGAAWDLDCVPFGHDAIRCGTTIRAKGEAHVTVNYRAVDERLESVAMDLLLHGDEEMITLRGGFDDDASLDGLRARIYRSANARITLETAPRPGEFMLTNGSDGDMVVESDGLYLLGYIVGVNDDGGWGRVHRPSVCITFDVPLSPRKSSLVAGASVRLEPGRYLYVVDFEDAETSDVAHVSRRVSRSFEVTEDVVHEYEEGPQVGWFLEFDVPDRWAGAEPPARPGSERPEGLKGSVRAEGAPRLADGSDIAGELSPHRSRHTYRLDLQPGEEAVVRIFARCAEAPCLEAAGIFSGDDDDHIRGSNRALHRDPPAWSFREDTIREEDEVLVIGCREKCVAGWEFYGRVHIRQLTKYER